MYNRYIRNDNGTYTRVPQEDAPPAADAAPARHDENGASGPRPSFERTREESSWESRHEPRAQAASSPFGGRVTDALSDTLRHALDHLHLEHVDTGDLLILVLLFLLFREDADEELLVALGLLLIL